MTAGKTVLVTGARGTVGNYVVALAEAAGHRVIASDVTAKGVRVPVRGEVRPGDLRESGVAERLVAGCDIVIHTAAQLDVGADSGELSAVNTDAVERLYEASAAAKVKRFVHTSTATLYVSTGEPLTEEAQVSPRGPYGMSKHAAEAVLRGRSAEDGPAWTIVRAAPIYGRRGRHFGASLLAVGPLLRLGTPVLPRSSGGPPGTMVHAEDVARALLFVARRDDTAGQVYNVSDGHVLPLLDRIGMTFDAYGLSTFHTGETPLALLRLAGKTFARPGAWHGADVSALAAWRTVVVRHGLKAALRPRLDRESMTLLYEDLVVDASKLRELGWEPRFPRFDDGFREVLRWYQAEGWVPRYG